MHVNRPRFYAAEIIALPTREQRRNALAKVPAEWRDWVEDLVRSAFALQKKRAPAVTGARRHQWNKEDSINEM
jgi:hypothetical protein